MNGRLIAGQYNKTVCIASRQYIHYTLYIIYDIAFMCYTGGRVAEVGLTRQRQIWSSPYGPESLKGKNRVRVDRAVCKHTVYVCYVFDATMIITIIRPLL